MANNPVTTMRNGMAICGVNDEALFEGETKAQRLANEMFDDNFNTALDKTFEEIDATMAEIKMTESGPRRIGIRRP